MNGYLPALLETIVSRYIVEQKLQDEPDLQISPPEVEQAVDQFRQQNQLADPQTFQAWLISQGWDETLFRNQIRFDLQLQAFKAQLAEPKLLEAFIEHKTKLDRVVLSRIVVGSRDLAEEIRSQISEGGSFEQLAQDYSQTEDALTNGLMGVASRAEIQQVVQFDIYQLPPATVSEVFTCREDYWLLRVEKLLPATLDESVTVYLQDQIFQQWLTKEMNSTKIDLLLS